MKIDRVSYSRLRSFGNFENETVSAEAQVEMGERPEDVEVRLRQWVNSRLDLGAQGPQAVTKALEVLREAIHKVGEQLDPMPF
jgi:hypothetical protein